MNHPLVYLTGVFALGIAAQWLAWRLKLPAILLLLLFGFAAGNFSNPHEIIGDELLSAVVSLSVALILFGGGLTLQFAELRETGRVVFRLVTVGALVTWLLSTLGAVLIFDDWRIAALMGAILVVTGPTVVIPLLRHVRPARRVGAVAKWEGIVIDPIGAVLAVLVYEVVAADAVSTAAYEGLIVLIKTVSVNVVLGLAAAQMLIMLLRRHWVPDFLHNPVLLAVVLVVFTASNLLQSESGLGTVTLLGVILANQRHVPVSHLVEFKETLGVLLVSALFILLASRLNLERLQDVGWEGLAFLAFLIIVVRPVSIFLATLKTKLTWAERWFLAWLAPRGVVAAAVSSVFALELLALVPEDAVASNFATAAKKLVPMMFVVIIGTVTVYGLTSAWVARRLGIADPDPQGLLIAGADPFVREIAAVVHAEGFPVLLVDTDYAKLRAARMLGLSTAHASIVSEYVSDEMDFAGIGRLLAMTSNEQVNTLACVRFIEHFGRANVYQLAPEPQRVSSKRQEVSSPLKARVLFAEGVSHVQLSQRFREGHIVKTTRLTPNFDEAAFRQQYRGAVLVLFVIRENGKLHVCSPDDTRKLQAGDTLISLVQKAEDAS